VPTVNDRTTRLLRLAATQLAIFVGMIHFWLGARNWSAYLSGGNVVPPDIRGPLFLVSGLVLMLGVAIVMVEDITDRRVYVGGIVLSAAYLLGYYAWHLGGHSFLSGGTRNVDLGGHGDPIEFFVSHTFVFNDPVMFFSLLTEAALLILLAILVRRPEPDI
jgi:hypothetical protein